MQLGVNISVTDWMDSGTSTSNCIADYCRLSPAMPTIGTCMLGIKTAWNSCLHSSLTMQWLFEEMERVSDVVDRVLKDTSKHPPCCASPWLCVLPTNMTSTGASSASTGGAKAKNTTGTPASETKEGQMRSRECHDHVNSFRILRF